MWGSSGFFVSGIVHNSDIAPITLAFLRELFTFLILVGVVFVWKREYFRVKKNDLVWLALMGGVGIGLFHVIWNYSVVTNGMSVATMLQYNEAAIISVAAVIFFKERMHWRKILAILSSLAGTVLISGGVELDIVHISQMGLLIGVSSAFAHSAFSLFGKKLAGSYHPITITVYAFGFGTLVLLPLTFFDKIPTLVSGEAISHFAILVLGPTLLAFGVFTAALKWIPVSTAAVIAISEVPIAAFLGFILLGETLVGWQIFGASLVVLGVMLVSLGGDVTA